MKSALCDLLSLARRILEVLQENARLTTELKALDGQVEEAQKEILQILDSCAVEGCGGIASVEHLLAAFGQLFAAWHTMQRAEQKARQLLEQFSKKQVHEDTLWQALAKQIAQTTAALVSQYQAPTGDQLNGKNTAGV